MVFKQGRYLLAVSTVSKDGIPWVCYDFDTKKQISHGGLTWYKSSIEFSTYTGVYNFWFGSASVTGRAARLINFSDFSELNDCPLTAQAKKNILSVISNAKGQEDFIDCPFYDYDV